MIIIYIEVRSRFAPSFLYISILLLSRLRPRRYLGFFLFFFKLYSLDPLSCVERSCWTLYFVSFSSILGLFLALSTLRSARYSVALSVYLPPSLPLIHSNYAPRTRTRTRTQVEHVAGGIECAWETWANGPSSSCHKFHELAGPSSSCHKFHELV